MCVCSSRSNVVAFIKYGTFLYFLSITVCSIYSSPLLPHLSVSPHSYNFFHFVLSANISSLFIVSPLPSPSFHVRFSLFFLLSRSNIPRAIYFIACLVSAAFPWHQSDIRHSHSRIAVWLHSRPTPYDFAEMS